MAFAVVLPREGFVTYGTDERSLVGMCSKMGPQVIGAGKSLGAEGALESRRMLLDALWVAIIRGTRRRLILWVCEAENIVALV